MCIFKPDAFELLRLIAAIQLPSRDDIDVSSDHLAAKVQDGSLIVIGLVGAAIVIDDVAVDDEHCMLNDQGSDER